MTLMTCPICSCIRCRKITCKTNCTYYDRHVRIKYIDICNAVKINDLLPNKKHQKLLNYCNCTNDDYINKYTELNRILHDINILERVDSNVKLISLYNCIKMFFKFIHNIDEFNLFKNNIKTQIQILEYIINYEHIK